MEKYRCLVEISGEILFNYFLFFFRVFRFGSHSPFRAYTDLRSIVMIFNLKATITVRIRTTKKNTECNTTAVSHCYIKLYKGKSVVYTHPRCENKSNKGSHDLIVLNTISTKTRNKQTYIRVEITPHI